MTFEEFCVEVGYEPKTTFWYDFSIAEKFGHDAVSESFDRIFKEWRANYVYLTELCLVMNWKGSAWYERDKKLAMIYFAQQDRVWNYAMEHLRDDEKEYFICNTD